MRRYKLILILWIIGVLVCTPLIMNANQVVTYQQQTFSTGQSDSDKASTILTKQFPTSTSNSTMIIVVETDDVSSPQLRDFILNLEHQIKSDSSLQYFEANTPGAFPKDLISVYTVQNYVLTQAVPGINAGMYQTIGMVKLVWGIPALYLQLYLKSFGINRRATAKMNAMIQEMGGGDPQTTQFLTEYFSLFHTSWLADRFHLRWVLRPQLRAERAARSAVANLASSSGIPSAESQMLLAIANTFSIKTFMDEQLEREFAVNSIAKSANITDTKFLYEIYDLGNLANISSENRNATVQNFVSTVVIPNGTLDTYPIQLPADMRSSFVSPDGHVTIISLAFTKSAEWVDSNKTKPIIENVKKIRTIISNLKETENVQDLATYVSGDAPISLDIEESVTKDFSLIEFVTIPVLIILMGLFFRSILTPVLPLGAVMVAVGLGQAVVYTVGTFVAGVDSNITTMLFSILMGVGTDYSIFIIARFREERIKGASREEAVKTSVTWAGESITTSGTTVIIAFMSLGIASYSMIRVMGFVMGLSILVALLISLTLVPSLLMLIGNRVFWPNNKERFKNHAKRIMERRVAGKHGYFYKAASFSVKHAKAIILVAVLISLPATYIYATAETSFDFIGTMPKVESIQGMNAMTAGFGAGRIFPSTIVIVFDQPVLMQDGSYDTSALQTIEQASAALAGNPVVHEVDGPTRPYGATVDYAHITALSANDQSTIRGFIGQDNRTVRLTFVLNAAPSSKEAVDSVRELRSAVDSTLSGKGVQEAYVGGYTAGLYDIMMSMGNEFNQMEILVVIGIFIVLVIVLGSLILPVFAVLSIMLSISWSFAATFLIFQSWLGVPILWLIPLILFIMLMGLGMDYNIFILTRIREEVHKGKSDEEAIVDAVDWTGGIITALAIIMGCAIGVLMLSSTKMLAEFGFAITFAILLDAMVVRTYIVPAAMKLLGKWNWYAPGPLQRERKEMKKQ
ncbi:MAG TPA: MMPL family transporter [Candidatus Thermoplasmatota archaeon]|nr:MMPL family transporter [Candidatus Thermoplasmatota archaeon]